MFRKALIAFIATAAIALAPTGASAGGRFGGGGFHGGGFHGGFARGGWHGGGWRGGFGPALAGGLLAGAVIGGIASSAYAWGPGYYEAPMCRGFGRLAVGELDRVDSLDHRTWCRMMRDRGRCAYPPLAIASFALLVPKTRAAPPGSSRPILPAGVNSQSFNTSLSGYCA